MSTITQPTFIVRNFTIKNKEDGKRYLFELVGEPKTMKEFREAFFSPEEYDFRTIRWLDTERTVLGHIGGVHVDPIYDSRDNAFVESE